MKRSVRIGAAAFVAFVIILIARFPAKWASGLLPEDIACDQIGGTLWHGTCVGLLVRGMPAGDVTWNLHPLKVLTGNLSARVNWVRGPAAVDGDVDFSLSGNIVAHDVNAALPLDPNLLPWVPPGLRGALSADLAMLRLEGHVVAAIEGKIDARGIEQRGTVFGDYRLTFPAAQDDTEPVGQLVDVEGPLKVAGRVKLTREPGYEIDGRVAAKPGAPVGLMRTIEFLGVPDGQGMRPFSLAGTY